VSDDVQASPAQSTTPARADREEMQTKEVRSCLQERLEKILAISQPEELVQAYRKEASSFVDTKFAFVALTRRGTELRKLQATIAKFYEREKQHKQWCWKLNQLLGKIVGFNADTIRAGMVDRMQQAQEWSKEIDGWITEFQQFECARKLEPEVVIEPSLFITLWKHELQKSEYLKTNLDERGRFKIQGATRTQLQASLISMRRAAVLQQHHGLDPVQEEKNKSTEMVPSATIDLTDEDTEPEDEIGSPASFAEKQRRGTR
jgi:hypothetical protein